VVRKEDFREDLLSIECKSSYLRINLFLSLSIWYPLFREIPAPFTKMEDPMKQSSLLPLETLPPRIHYGFLFQYFPSLSLGKNDRGRPPLSRDALLKAFIYKALRRLKTLTDLAFELQNNPTICQAVGFDPYRSPPSIERFSQFLRSIPHAAVETVRTQLVRTLLKEEIISGHHLVLDSCAIPAHVRENNLKSSISNRFDKSRRPKGDPDARMGLMIHYPLPFKEKIRSFWGYRNHIVVDAEEQLPLWEVTLPADRSEVHQAIPMLQKIKETFSIIIETVGGDAIYDTENILRFVVEDLQARPIIPHNPRAKQGISYRLVGSDVHCQADLPMCRKGKMTAKRTGITYLQYCCVIYYWKEKRRYLLCPAAHPKFTTKKGCTVLIRLTPSIRERIDYGSEAFKEFHRKRTSVERVFSRLLCIAMQDPPVIGIDAIRNYCTIAHITVLLVALVAKRSGYPDKIRYVRSFVPIFCLKVQNEFREALYI